MPKVNKSDLPITDKIALAAISVLGKAVAKAAYLMAHPDATENQASRGVLVSRWLHSDLAVEFMQRVTTGTATVNPPDEANDLTTRQGLINQLVAAAKQTTGRDSVTALTSLAKIQGLDRPEDGEQSDPRRFFVAWKSDCRRCELMRLFRKVQAENKKS